MLQLCYTRAANMDAMRLRKMRLREELQNEINSRASRTSLHASRCRGRVAVEDARGCSKQCANGNEDRGIALPSIGPPAAPLRRQLF
jgi:hypothetical protein